MSRVEPRSLVRRLSPTATKMLETGVSRAVSSRHREISVEHLLAAMLDSDDGDTGLILRALEKNRGRLQTQVEKTLGGFRADSQGKPVFSDKVFRWLEDAWLFASLELGANTIRSGVLFARFLELPERYSAEEFDEIADVDGERVLKEFRSMVATSNETAETTPAAAGAPMVSSGAAEALAKFTVSFTDRAKAGKIDKAYGRHREIRQLADILTRRRKNNPIIVGEPGVGKTALVEGLAVAIAEGAVPDVLKDVDLRSLDLGALQAGASVKGEFENRLKAVIEAVKTSPRPVVLFIDEAHTIIGAGGAAGTGDAANLLKPELARGELRTIAATTWSEYKKYFEKDAALERRFQPVKVEQPSIPEAIDIMRGLRELYEKAHGVLIRDDAVVAAVELSERYVSGRQLPDKSIDVLDTASARVKLELTMKPDAVVDLETQLVSFEREVAVLKRDGVKDADRDASLVKRMAETKKALAEKTERWQTDLKAVHQRLEWKAQLEKKPDDAGLLKQLEDSRPKPGSQAMVHDEVDADVVAQVIAGWTGIPVGKMHSDSIAAVLKLEEKLRTRVKGQENAAQVIAETIRMAQAGIRNPGQPIGVLLFVGPSGVGKTEAALTLADTLYGGERFVVTINMSEFQEKHSVSRLIGSPPGYVGYGQGGVLTEAVRQRPYSVVLLDEVEKADLEVMNLFYQVFDKGMLSDSEGRLIDFRNTVLVLTSNLASDKIMELHQGETPPTPEAVTTAIRPVLAAHFKPALLARMTVVPFAPLPAAVLQDITRMKLQQLAARLELTHRLTTEFSPEVVQALTRRATDPESGARNLEHVLRASLMPAIASELLSQLANEAKPRKLLVTLSPTDEWRIDFE